MMMMMMMMMSTLLNLYCAVSLKQQSRDRHVAPFKHIIDIANTYIHDRSLVLLGPDTSQYIGVVKLYFCPNRPS
jgi:hypothetical protein